MKKSDIKSGVIAVLLLMTMAIVFILWCVGTWEENAGYEEFPQEAYEAPAVRSEGLKVQAVFEGVEPQEIAKAEPEQVTVKLENVAISTVYESMPTETVEVSQVNNDAHYDSIPLSAELQAVLFECCEQNGIRLAVALALIETESCFNPYAVNSYSGCYGLCQLNPACFPSGLSPADNIRYGMEYLGRQLRVYGSEAAGLTAYTVGHDNGTRSYANVVLSRAEKWQEIVG